MSRALIVMATGEYNDFMPKLISSSREYFGGHIYIFTDKPDDYKGEDITTVEILHHGWPKMPLLRFETIHNYRDIFKENYLFLIDAEAVFKKAVTQSINSHRVATLHRNIRRLRPDYNYEKRIESTAYVSSQEGERYFACGFVGGLKNEFLNMAEFITRNIRTDISNGIRAIWGDESHLNRYLIDNPPTLILPPNYMCPEKNPFFIPYIMHRDKKFKRVNIDDAEKFSTINKDDYKLNV